MTPSPSAGAPHFARAAHSHLFPGSRVHVEGVADPAAFAREPRPLALELAFADGSRAAADLLVPQPGRPGPELLAVAAYETRAGTELPGHTWTVRGYECDGSALVVRIGVKVP